eukprot:3791829-Pyramimonas_sp.AAC.1
MRGWVSSRPGMAPGESRAASTSKGKDAIPSRSAREQDRAYWDRAEDRQRGGSDADSASTASLATLNSAKLS